MRSSVLLGPALVLCHASAVLAQEQPVVVDPAQNLTYRGSYLAGNTTELFSEIQYGDYTGGEWRFKPPRPYVYPPPPPGSEINTARYGLSCIQDPGQPLETVDRNEYSEDCLNLVIERPAGTLPDAGLPVIVWIHGGGFWSGYNGDPAARGTGLIQQSILNGLPVIQVNINYRLGVFGFAQSGALEAEGSENAGLRDQRLAIEWVRDNIGLFGGNGNRITIAGHSSGAFSVGLQALAFGGAKPVPFQQGICESQALEQRTTGNLTRGTMQELVDLVGCGNSDLGAPETLACLRAVEDIQLLNASIAIYGTDAAHNGGDVWMPVVDGDFLPDAPSQMLRDGKFADVDMIIGWTNDEMTFYTDSTIKTADDSANFFRTLLPGLTSDNLNKLLDLYPVSEFAENAAANRSAEYYRSARIFRDLEMTCAPSWYGQSLAARGNAIYHYHWNQTILDPILTVQGSPGLGIVHQSEMPYIFGLRAWQDTEGFAATDSDWALQNRSSRSWSTFANTGQPSLEGKDTLQGWGPAFDVPERTQVLVVGGPDEGLTPWDGPDALPAVAAQKLRERCAFLTSAEILTQMEF